MSEFFMNCPNCNGELIIDNEWKNLNVNALDMEKLDVLLEKIDEILATVRYLKELSQNNLKASEESVVAADNSPKDQQ